MENKYYKYGKRTKKALTTIVVSTLLATNLYTAQELDTSHSEQHELRNELVSLDEETATYYYLYKETLNDLYMLEVETGLYNETNMHNKATNPMTGETFYLDNK